MNLLIEYLLFSLVIPLILLSIIRAPIIAAALLLSWLTSLPPISKRIPLLKNIVAISALTFFILCFLSVFI